MAAEWCETIQAFWVGMMDVEYIAWKGSHQIFIFPCDEYPNPPSEIIQYTKRIETLEDFEDAFQNGVRFSAKYQEVKHEQLNGTMLQRRVMPMG